MTARIAILDIETAPTRAFAWRMWKENLGVDHVERDGYVLCGVAKFLHEKKPRKLSLPETKRAHKEDDYAVVKFCWEIMNEADIVVAHNAKGFDIPVLNARFMANGFTPPSPYRIVDTLLVARKKFKFPHASLDGIARYLGKGRKDKTDFSLWVGCMEGDPKAWRKMVNYCVKDVLILEDIYKMMVPWIDTHPNMGLYDGDTRPACPKCGSHSVSWQGYHRTLTQVYHSFRCNKCGGWGRERTTCLEKDKKSGVMTHAVPR